MREHPSNHVLSGVLVWSSLFSVEQIDNKPGGAAGQFDDILVEVFFLEFLVEHVDDARLLLFYKSITSLVQADELFLRETV